MFRPFLAIVSNRNSALLNLVSLITRVMDLVQNEVTQLKPTETINNPSPSKLSPQRLRSARDGFSPIRRSGSPERRAIISQYEQRHALRLKALSAQDPAEPTVKKAKNVKFNSEVEYFDESLNENVNIFEELKEIRKTQTILMDKMDLILNMLSKK